MAADTSTATLVSQPNNFHHHAYKSSNYSNMTLPSGANTPMNVSPTSPRTTSQFSMHPNHVPQIRRPKNPIYLPAALRRTEQPTRQSPPRSEADAIADAPNSSWGAEGCGVPVAGDSIITRIATNDLGSIHGDGPLSPVTGPVTRNHWQSNTSTSVCTAPDCETIFGWLNRRHHCRKCGGIFCARHSQRQVKLNEDALFHPDGELERACDRCYNHYGQWEQRRNSRQNSETSSNASAAVRIDTPISIAQRPDLHQGSVANSLGGAWNWSTF